MDELSPSYTVSDFGNTTRPNGTDFNYYFDPSQWMRWSLLPACAIFVLFCCLEKRVNLWPTCCHGRPGVAFPVNLVDNYTDRWAFAFAFGSMSAILIKAVVSGPLFVTSDKIATVTLMLQGTVEFFAYIIDALVISLVFYPILLCLQTQWRLLGNIFGLLYSIAWLIFYIGSIVVTAMSSRAPPLASVAFFKILQEFNVYGSGAICFSALVIFFLVGLAREVRNGIKLGFIRDHDASKVDFSETHFYQRVKFILTPPVPKKRTSGNVILRLFRQYVYIGTVPGFRFSRRNICTFVLTVVTTIQIVLIWIDAFGLLLKILDQSSLLPLLRKHYPGLDEDINNVEITFWVTSAVAVIFTAVYTLDMQLRYREHTVKLWKGDRSFVPEGKLLFSETLVASLRYSGYHVAFTLWGFIIVQLLLWLIWSFIIVFWDEARYLLEKYWLTLGVTFAFYYGQVYISQIVFLQRAPDQEKKSAFICWKRTSFGLDNRRVFHVTLYILMFVNFLLGIVSCFVRILKALAFGTLYIGRLDRLLLMRDWETWDRGYTAYVGFLQLEVAHTHPVLITFCHFLQKTVKTDQASSQKYTTKELVSIVNSQIESGYEMPETTNGRCYSPREPSIGQLSRRMRNKWLVALTLTRNPSLVSERKGALKEAKRTRTESSGSQDVSGRDELFSGDVIET